MNRKKCNGCGLVLSVDNFGKESRAKNGYKPRCKSCSNAYYREFYSNSGYRERKIANVKNSYQSNRESRILKQREYYQKNKERIKEYNRQYRQDNLKSIVDSNNEYIKKRRKEDDSFKALLFMRKQLHRCFSDGNKKSSKLLGYTKNELLNHLGGTIPEGYSIDHKIPISWFSEDAPLNIVHDLRNLQLLNNSENSTKGNKYADPVEQSYYKECIQHIRPTYQSEVHNYD